MTAIFYFMFWLGLWAACHYAIEYGYRRHFWLYFIVFGSLAYWTALVIWTYICPYFLNIE